MFQFKWLRRFVRKNTQKIPESVAHISKQRLSIVYAFFAWNAFGLVLYQIFRGKADWAEHHGLSKEDGTPAQQYARLLNIPKAKVVRISGINSEQYDIDNTNDADFNNRP